MDEVEITGDEAVLINRITTIDRDVDAIQKHTIELVEAGTRGGAGGILRIAEDRADEHVARLQAERADLVRQLKQSTGVD